MHSTPDSACSRVAPFRVAMVTAAMALAFLPRAQAQVSVGGSPLSSTMRSLAPAPIHSLGFIDLAALAAEDAQAGKDEAWRFGATVEADLGLDNAGIWTRLDNGDRLWRLSIHSDGAYSLNCQFDQFVLPAGGRLFVYNSDRSMVLGAFTKANNKPNGQFAIQPVEGETITLEYLEPAKYEGSTLLHINTIVHDYRDFYGMASQRNFGDSGSCNNNVVCPEGAPWANEIRSVGMLLEGGFRYCSGAMINNTADNGRQLFLSANHCTPGANDIIMFNYNSPTCANANGPTNMTVQGLTQLSNGSASDYWLVEVVETIPQSYGVYLAGWDATGTVPPSTVGIHHPSGDVKKITFDNNSPGISAYGGGSGTNHWHIFNWEDGTTEGGSSGSPLFNNNHQIIGQLHGGTASCSNNIDDYYGRLSVSYSAGAGTYLNPGGGILSQAGRELYAGGGSGPVNDTCASATIVSDGVYPFDTTEAAADQTMPCANGGGPDLFYLYNSPCGATVTVSTCNDADYDTALGLLSDCSGTYLACNDDFAGCNLTSSITFTADPGVDYVIQVAGYDGDSGTGNLTISSVGGVPNETCATAMAVGTGSHAFDTSCSSQSLAMTCASGGGPDLWYSFSAPSAGTLEVNTCGSTGWDTALALYSDCSTVITCNDDDCSVQSRVTSNVSAGSTTLIQVSGYNGNSGAGSFNLLFTPTANNNDLCENAILVGEGVTAFSNVGATTDGPDEPGACTAFNYTNVGSDIWYEYVPAVNADVTVSLCGSGYDTKMAVYEGSCPAVESAIACNDDFCNLQSEVTFAALGGTSYIIRIGGYNGATGSGTMTISLVPTCSDLTPLAPQNLSVSIVGNTVNLNWDDVTESVAGCPLAAVSYTVWATDADGNVSVAGSSAVSNISLVGYNATGTVRTLQVTASEVVARGSHNTIENASSERSKPVEILPRKQSH
ncbi:MAG: hypothetical protein KC518_06590 [Candidatus Cloacimonetes bacterium]|nr:hypothetical protein [Candidatus Cloacimonadota bacterium]